jgi:hypothetical protein
MARSASTAWDRFASACTGKYSTMGQETSTAANHLCGTPLGSQASLSTPAGPCKGAPSPHAWHAVPLFSVIWAGRPMLSPVARCDRSEPSMAPCRSRDATIHPGPAAGCGGLLMHEPAAERRCCSEPFPGPLARRDLPPRFAPGGPYKCRPWRVTIAVIRARPLPLGRGRPPRSRRGSARGGSCICRPRSVAMMTTRSQRAEHAPVPLAQHNRTPAAHCGGTYTVTARHGVCAAHGASRSQRAEREMSCEGEKTAEGKKSYERPFNVTQTSLCPRK